MSTTKIRPRTLAVLAAFVGLMGVVAVTVPSSAVTTATEVRLHLGTDGRYFQFGGTTQPLTARKNGCEINSAEPVIDLSSPEGLSPGLGPDGIGVKQSASSGNGSPCTQVESVETLRLEPSGALPTLSFEGVRLDLEMTGNALVELTFLPAPADSSLENTYVLQTGTQITLDQTHLGNPPETDYDQTAPYFVSSGPGDEIDACAAPNSSGPNSGGNDNCQWTVRPGFDFDAIELTTTQGTVSLEGSGDFGNSPAYDTLLYVATNDPPVAVNGSASTPEETAVTVTVATDADSTVLEADCTYIDQAGNVSNEGVTDNGDGSVTFVPPLDFNGTITLTCSVTDDQGASAETEATITVGVTEMNDRPVAMDDPGIQVDEDSSVVIPVLANDTDVDDGVLGTLAVTDIRNVNPATPPGATAIANADGTVTYTPPPGYTGPGSFTYRVIDGGGLTSTLPATVSITVYPVICTNIPVTDKDGDVTGTFTLLPLANEIICKRYNLDAVNTTTVDTVLFEPSGSSTVSYRGVLEFGPESAPAAGSSGEYSLLLRYDPDDDGPILVKPVQWCIAPQFDGNNQVIGATLPTGETWCVASGYTKGAGSFLNPQVITVWQVFGRDDPKFLR